MIVLTFLLVMTSDLLHMCLEGVVSLELEDGRSATRLKALQLFR
jgi:hypothetical protein